MKGKKVTASRKNKKNKDRSRKPVLATSDTVKTDFKGPCPVDMTADQAKHMNERVLHDGTVSVVVMVKQLDIIYNTKNKRVNFGLVCALPPYAPTGTDEQHMKVAFVPCTPKSLRDQGCPGDICMILQSMDYDKDTFIVAACPHKSVEPGASRSEFGILWSSSVISREMAAKVAPVRSQDYPAISLLDHNFGDFDEQLTRSGNKCSLSGCDAPGKYRCSRCRRFLYCSVECQTLHWPHHKMQECVKIEPHANGCTCGDH